MASARAPAAVPFGLRAAFRFAGGLGFGFGAVLAMAFFDARGAVVAGLRAAGFAADVPDRSAAVRAFGLAAFVVLPAIPPSRVTFRWPPVYSASKLHEVFAHDDLSGEVTSGRLAPGLAGHRIGGDQMREDEHPDARRARDGANLIFSRVAREQVLAQPRRVRESRADRVERRLVHHLVDEHVGALRERDEAVAGRRVAGEDDRPVARVEAERERRHDWRMTNERAGDANALVAVDLAGSVDVVWTNQRRERG